MPLPTNLPAPKANVSPLIKLGRWTALIVGIAYGSYRYKYLANREIGIQQYENELKEKYRQKKSLEKAQKEKDEMDSLGREAGVVAK